MWNYVYPSYELYHHGVRGQKWGKKNGPPYPLAASAHSASEKKAGWKKSLSGGSGHSRTYKGSKSGSSSKPQEKESNTLSAGFFVAKMALDIVGLNPIGLVRDAKRLIDYGKSKKQTALESKRIANLRIDKKTGFRLKDSECSPEEDMKRINPGFKNFDSNTKNNCMLCTTAYEMRRRGYDVQAGTATKGYMDSEVLKWFPKAKIENSYHLSSNSKERTKELIKSSFLSGFTGKEKYDKLSKSLLKHGDGARGNLMVQWSSGGGHSVVWEVQNGNLVIRDCQSNKIYSSRRQIENLLSITVAANFARTDNVDFDLKAIREHLR